MPQNVLLHVYKIPRTSESKEIESTLVSARLGDRRTRKSVLYGNRVSIRGDQELNYTIENDTKMINDKFPPQFLAQLCQQPLWLQDETLYCLH